MDPFPVYIGFDAREPVEFDVARKSLIRHSSVPLHVVALRRDKLSWPSGEGIFDREQFFREGQRYDAQDGKPFSTDFSFTRFLVPILQQYEGWALFHDSDMVWRADIAELLALRDDKFAAMVVKHHHVPTEDVKMDGCVQTVYRRKNWSSFVLWNCSHPANQALTRYQVNHNAGSWLHAFTWLKDDEIGELPLTWNFLVGVNTVDECEKPNVLHFTKGTPEMSGFEDSQFSDIYWWEKNREDEVGG